MLLGIERYRSLSTEEQLAEWEFWNKLGRPEKKVYQDNFNALVHKKKDLLHNNITWEEAAPRLEEELAAVPSSTGARGQQRARSLTVTNGKNWIAGFTAKMEAQKAALAAAARTAPRAVTPTEEEEETDDVSYVPTVASQWLRDKEAARKRKAASSGSRRRRGSFATKLIHQQDAVANAAVEAAFLAVARARDTLYCASLLAGQPRRSLLLVDISELRDTRPEGGQVCESKIRREKTLVTVVGPTDRAELSWVMENLGKAYKHKDSKRLKHHERLELFPTHHGQPLVDTINAMVAERAQARGQPAASDISLQDIFSQQLARLQQEEGLP